MHVQRKRNFSSALTGLFQSSNCEIAQRYQLPDSACVFFPRGVSRYVTGHCRNNAKSSLYANIVAKRLLQACLAAQKT